MSDDTTPGKDWTLAQRVASLAGAFAYEGHREVVLQLAKEVGALEALTCVVNARPTGAVSSEGARGAVSVTEATNARPTGAVWTPGVGTPSASVTGFVSFVPETGRTVAFGDTEDEALTNGALALKGAPVDSPNSAYQVRADPSEPWAKYAAGIATSGSVGPEHPAPWRWNDGDDDNGASLLLDSSGAVVISVNKFTEWETPDQARMTTSPLARELIRLAPELEKALRFVYDELVDEEVSSGAQLALANADEILAKLDAARKEP